MITEVWCRNDSSNAVAEVNGESYCATCHPFAVAEARKEVTAMTDQKPEARRAGTFAMDTPGLGRSWHIVEDGRTLCEDVLQSGRTEYLTTGEMPEWKVCIECVGVADGIEVLTQDECDAIGADGRDGRGTITVANITAAEATRLIDFRAGG